MDHDNRTVDVTSSASKPAPVRKTRLTLVAASSLLLVVSGILLAIFLMSGVKASDYEDAREKADEMLILHKDARIDISKVKDMGNTSEDSIKAASEKLRQNQDSMNRLMSELGQAKVVAKDEDVKKSYNDLKAQIDKYNNAITWARDAYNSVGPAQLYWTGISDPSLPTKISERYKVLRDQFKSIKASHEINKKYVADLIPRLDRYIETVIDVEKMEAGAIPYDESIRDTHMEVIDYASEVIYWWQGENDRLSKDTQINNAIEQFIKVLSDKYNQSK